MFFLFGEANIFSNKRSTPGNKAAAKANGNMTVIDFPRKNTREMNMRLRISMQCE